MIQEICFSLLVIANLLMPFIPKYIFLNKLYFVLWLAITVVLGLLDLYLIAFGIAIFWIHGIIISRPKYISLPTTSAVQITAPPLSETKSPPESPPKSPPRTYIDPTNIQGNFYGLKGFDINPY